MVALSLWLLTIVLAVAIYVSCFENYRYEDAWILRMIKGCGGEDKID